jgi:hypothetical protein
MGLVAGLALPYLMEAQKRADRGFKIWAVWLGTMASLFGLAHAMGYATKLPETTEAIRFAGVALMAASFWGGFKLMKQRLGQRKQ